jgi:hypothetical protein
MRLPSVFSLIIASLLSPTLLHAAERANEPEITFRPDAKLTTDEAAALLGGYLWKLDVIVPKGSKTIWVSIEQKTGKATECSTLVGTIGDSVASDESSRSVLIAIVPIGGSISQAEKVRISIATFSISPEARGTCSTVGEAVNPLRNLNISSHFPPESLGKGECSLIDGYKDGQTVSVPSGANVEQSILVKIEAK